MKKLIKLKKNLEVCEKEFKWQYQDNPSIELYRRSMIPFYLLEHEAITFPRYVDYSDLSKNLCSEYTTNIKLYFSPKI